MWSIAKKQYVQSKNTFIFNQASWSVIKTYGVLSAFATTYFNLFLTYNINSCYFTFLNIDIKVIGTPRKWTDGRCEKRCKRLIAKSLLLHRVPVYLYKLKMPNNELDSNNRAFSLKLKVVSNKRKQNKRKKRYWCDFILFCFGLVWFGLVFFSFFLFSFSPCFVLISFLIVNEVNGEMQVIHFYQTYAVPIRFRNH